MDEFAIDLDKVLDEFEKSEEGESADTVHEVHRELETVDNDQPRTSSGFPAFGGLDLDLAEADFAPSCWNYAESLQENNNDGNEIQDNEGLVLEEKSSDPQMSPEAELMQNVNEIAPGLPEALDFLPVVGKSAEVDVLSACPHAFGAAQESDEEPDEEPLQEQHENEAGEEVVTSPPDIVRSAPDLVSSAIVGVDVVPFSCADASQASALNLDHEHNDLLQQAVPTHLNQKVSNMGSRAATIMPDIETGPLSRLEENGANTDLSSGKDFSEDNELANKSSEDSLCVNETSHASFSNTESAEVGHEQHALSASDSDAKPLGSNEAAGQFSDFNVTDSRNFVSPDVAFQSFDHIHKSSDSAVLGFSKENKEEIEIPSSADSVLFLSSAAYHSNAKPEVLEGFVPEGTEPKLCNDQQPDEVNKFYVCESSNGLDQKNENENEVCRSKSELNSALTFKVPVEIEEAERRKMEMAEETATRAVEILLDESANEKSEVDLDLEKENLDSKLTEGTYVQSDIMEGSRDITLMGIELEKNRKETGMEGKTYDKSSDISDKDPVSSEILDKMEVNMMQEIRKTREIFEADSKDEALLGKTALSPQYADITESVSDGRRDVSCKDSHDSGFPELEINKTGFTCATDGKDLTEDDTETYLRETDKDGKDLDANYSEQQEELTPSVKRSSSPREESSYVSFPVSTDGDELTKVVEEVYSELDLVSSAEMLQKASSDFCDIDNMSRYDIADDKTIESNLSPLEGECFAVFNSHTMSGEDSIPEEFGNLGDEELQNLMKEVVDEMEQMMQAEKRELEADTDHTKVNISGLENEISGESDVQTNVNVANSFEEQAMFVVCNGSEVKELERESDILVAVAKTKPPSVRNGALDQSIADVIPSPYIHNGVASDSAKNVNGIERAEIVRGGTSSCRTTNVASSEVVSQLPGPNMDGNQRQAEAVGLSLPSVNENHLLPADDMVTPSSVIATGARQKQSKMVQPENTSSAANMQLPTTESVATSEGAQLKMPEVVVSQGGPAQPSPVVQSTVAASLNSTIPLCSNISLEITQLGKVAPVWLPDAEASKCMECDVPFSFTRRRHHCRACGKVFCHGCSSLRATLPYLENRQDRVCSKCYQDLVRASYYERTQPALSMRPNPSDSDSTVSPTAHVLMTSDPQQPLSSVSAPTGVLRKQGSVKLSGEAKQVMFSDGIRPGGELTELDGSSTTRTTSRRPRKADKSSAAAAITSAAAATTVSASQMKNPTEAKQTSCLIPSSGLPPVVTYLSTSGEFELKENVPPDDILKKIKNVQELNPVAFAINRDVLVMVKIVNLDCCVNRTCWCFTTKGLCTVGQDEVVIVLECLPDERTVPIDILRHLHVLYEMASHGNTVNNLDHTVLPSGSLGSHETGGFLYVRQTFQCLQKLMLPDPPYLFGLLLQKWEMSWARVFPLRLMFRLGAEFRYYPCPLISVRNRKSVYGEIGHTIMNLLADFHNYQYMVPRINGLVIHMEDKRTTVSIPRNRYNMLMKILNNSDDHVIALGASFSSAADSHLVCLQNDDGNYQTQAINIQNRPRRVTGACFIVFNGALKPTSGLRAKSSIVEDGLMVQITSDAMTELKQVLSEIRDFKILCGSIEIAQPDEMVVIEWNNDEKNINTGVKSPIDGLSMYGVDSIRIHGSTDYAKDQLAIRWTEVFVLCNGATSSGASSEVPTDVSHLAESLAQACCQALVAHLSQLAFEMLTKIGLRVTIDAEQVGYEIGSRGIRLPDFCMNDLDEKLIGVIHGAASQARSGPLVLELLFHIIHPYTTHSHSSQTPGVK